MTLIISPILLHPHRMQSGINKLQILDESVDIKIFLQITNIHPISCVSLLVVFIRALFVLSVKNQLKVALSKQNNLLAQYNQSWLLTQLDSVLNEVIRSQSLCLLSRFSCFRGKDDHQKLQVTKNARIKSYLPGLYNTLISEPVTVVRVVNSCVNSK